MEVSSHTCSTAAAGGSKDQQLLVSLQGQPGPAIYADITLDHQQQATEGDGDAPGIMQMWPCPDAPHLSPESCYIHIQYQMMGTKSPQGREEASTIDVPEIVSRAAKILHVHDSLFITSIPSATSYLGSE